MKESKLQKKICVQKVELFPWHIFLKEDFMRSLSKNIFVSRGMYF